MSDNEE
jgi:hypothetical protein